jgi:phosphatidylglycerophosphate synthase
MTFLLAGPERTLLRAVARRLPAAVRSNHLTAIGVAGALGAGLGYALSGDGTAWLWFASAMLAVNWFGDSLDGTVARVRQAERPRYGYYLDHVVDAFSTAAIGLGIGLSPYVSLDVALLLVVAYLMLSINVYLESSVFGAFRMAYGRIGPTEARLILIGINTALALGLGDSTPMAPRVLAAANAVVVGGAGLMLALLAVRFGRNLRELAVLEPVRRYRNSLTAAVTTGSVDTG